MSQGVAGGNETSEVATLLERGGAATEAGDWTAARDVFRQALAAEETPEAYFGLGNALWWLNETGEAMRCWEAAYAGFHRRGDAVAAVNAAVVISLIYNANFGNRTVANGWSARAARLAEPLGIPELDGWVLLAKAAPCEHPAQVEEWARQALTLAEQAGARDLELCALSSLGSALMHAGQVEEGACLMDEALAGALGGEVQSLDTVVYTTCLLMQSCYRSADFSRIIQWSPALHPFIERYGCPYVNATCRTHYGAVLVATGDWVRAEDELRAATRLAGEALPAVQAEVAAYLAELRLAQGRVDEALAVLDGFEDQPVVVPVLAAVRLAGGDAALAASIARRRLEAAGASVLEAARLGEVLGEALLATGDSPSAAAHGRRLAEAGAAGRCELAVARGERLLGRALAAAGDDEDARRRLEAALACFIRLEMPWEAARTKLALAAVLASTEPALARAEAGAALAVFEGLGAARDAKVAAEWLAQHAAQDEERSPNVAGQQRDLATLTRRERDVLSVLGQGLSNPEIAERLYISRRTVEHHVASVLSKLGLRNRTEAAAFAVRHLGDAVPQN